MMPPRPPSSDADLRRVLGDEAPLFDRLQAERRLPFGRQRQPRSVKRDLHDGAGGRALIVAFVRTQQRRSERDDLRRHRRCGIGRGLHHRGNRRIAGLRGQRAGAGERRGVGLFGRERDLHGCRIAPPDRRVQHADGAWRLVLEQVDGDVEVTAAQRHVDRPRSVERIDDVHVRTTLDEQPDDVEVAAFGGEPQRADAVFISGVDADARRPAAPTTRARSPVRAASSKASAGNG